MHHSKTLCLASVFLTTLFAMFFSAQIQAYKQDAPVVKDTINIIPSSTHRNSDDLVQPLANKRLIVTTPIIYEAFQKKKPDRPLNGIASESYNSKEDIYIRVENNNYFVKFCSSKVTRADIEAALAKQQKQPQVTLDITLTIGSWDRCQSDEMVQSRIGRYVILHRIINKGESVHE